MDKELIKIFVEGPADRQFLKDYILTKYDIIIKKEQIIETKGWNQIYSEGELIKNTMYRNTESGGVNLLIFDADENFGTRLAQIETWKNNFNLSFEQFLWPNHASTGDLETVLENIININNKPIFDCWESYETCLQYISIENRNEPLTTPARKTKIYGYLEALLGNSKSEKKKIKEPNRDYTNQDFWNLNSQYLNPLKDFLNPKFI